MRISAFVVILLLLISCSSKNTTLPILGPKQFSNVGFEGGIKADTIYHTIRDFSFVDQDSNMVTNETFRDKIYVADFFFTSCPTICPIMKTQMLRVYQKYSENPEVKFLSHSIDPEFDTVAVLHDFAERLGVRTEVWHFVTGIKDSIYSIGQESYMVTATTDPNEPGGYLHSGAFLLIDKQRRIRGIYDGTKPDKVDLLMNDIAILLEEYKP
ncbi:MAG: SCO family protein [Cyclobacteriaceae bacterium]|nr:SCO family protein [Cyclobacteriaceae bacterium]